MAEYTGRNRESGGYDELNLPYSLEAEQAVLGAILIDPQCINQVADALRP